MDRRIFDSETLLDLTVNVIPLAIMLFFVALFAVVNPWGFDLLHSSVQFGILIVMIAALAVLTYVSAKAIEGDAMARADEHGDGH